MGDIDAFVQALIHGGDGWRVQDMQTGFVGWTTGAHNSYTHLDITGQGMLVGIHSDEYSSPRDWAVQIDGGAIRQVKAYTDNYLLMIPFQSSLKVSCSSSPGSLTYATALLGDPSLRWSSLILATSCAKGTKASHLANTLLNIAGSGCLMAIARKDQSSSAPKICVELDGRDETILPGFTYSVGQWDHAHLFILPFTTSLKVTSDATTSQLSLLYKLD